MRHLVVTVFFLFLANGAMQAAEVEETARTIVLRNAGAEYHFDHGKQYHLKESFFQGRKVWPAGLQLTYNMPGDKWFWEDKPYELYQMAPYQHEIVRLADGISLETIASGENMTLRRTYTLRGQSPALEVMVHVEISGENLIRWTNLVSMPLPLEHNWLRLVSRVRQGKIITRLEQFSGNPFLDQEGKPVNINGQTLSQWSSLSMIGSFNPETELGAIVMVAPESTPWQIRAGISGNAERGFAGISPRCFSQGENGKTFLRAQLSILPFAGDPERLNDVLIPEFVEKLRQADLISTKYVTGKLLHNSPELTLWSELPHNRVFRSEVPPPTSAQEVCLYAGKDEAESFQLVLKSERELSAVSLRLSGFVNGDCQIPGQWQTVDYISADIPWSSEQAILGEMPDSLLPETMVDCPAGQAQPFLLTWRVPADAEPGIYRGQVELMSGNTLLAEIPVRLQVWNFSLHDATLTAALDFWRRGKSYPKEQQEEIFRQVEEMVVNSRGGERWLSNPKPTWNENGELLSVDYSSFDRSLRKAQRKYRHKVLVTRAFMLGFGHVPRKNLFGNDKEILNPLWTKKMTNFATDLKRHMQEHHPGAILVFDLFDEPLEKYVPMMQEVVKILREINPEWKFTFACCDFFPELLDTINFWNLPMNGNRTSRVVIEQIRQAGGELSVYNPPEYAYNTALTNPRGAYIWLWRHNVRYVYQWVVNCWRERGERGSDAYRSASWIAPGEKGPLNTLRMEATRDGIEDYEYLSLLRREGDRLRATRPELSARAEDLLEQAHKLAWRTANDERNVVITQNPELFDQFHRQAGALLDEMSRH